MRRRDGTERLNDCLFLWSAGLTSETTFTLLILDPGEKFNINYKSCEAFNPPVGKYEFLMHIQREAFNPQFLWNILYQDRRILNETSKD